MVREATEDHLRFWAAAIPATLYPSAFVDSLVADSERVFCMKACLLVYVATNYTLVPRRLQLLAALAILYCSTLVLARDVGIQCTCHSTFHKDTSISNFSLLSLYSREQQPLLLYSHLLSSYLHSYLLFSIYRTPIVLPCCYAYRFFIVLHSI